MAILIGLLLLAWSLKASARAVVSEVMWAGSDLSSADEWVEIACIDAPCDFTGWRLTSLNGKGEETTIVRFSTGSTMAPGQFAVLANSSADVSRLAMEPWIVASSMSLPNTKLLLRLRDGAGSIMDQVDDGVGAPFAGANKMQTGSGSNLPAGQAGVGSAFLWASMERIDLFGSGALKSNWRTAEEMSGWDDGAPMRGTPFTDIALLESKKSEQFLYSCKPFDASIAVQSGKTASAEKVTINVQATASGVSVSSLRCSFDFSDGTRLDTCNPPSHTFTEKGYHTITLRAADRCGKTVTRSLDVEVRSAQPQSLERYAPPACTPDTFALDDVVISAMLPDPQGDDAVGEWIAIRNTGPFHLQLCGLALQGNAKGIFPLDTIVLDAGAEVVLPRKKTGIALGNEGGSVRLLLRSKDGLAHVVQEVAYDAPPAGRRLCRNDDGRYAWSFPVAGIALGPPAVVITGVKPNPGADDEEWMELSSASPASVDLSGWSVISAGSDHPLLLDGLSVVSGHALRVPVLSTRDENGFVELLDPQGRIVSVAAWDSAEQGDVVRPFRSESRVAFGRVDYVFDGDTFSVLLPDGSRRGRSARVRMIGIDAPGIPDDFSDASGDTLRELLLGKEVRLEFDGAREDAYDRLLAYVFQNGRDIGAQMIASGNARAVTEFPFGRLLEYAAIEDYARERRVGIWMEME
jgi:micrococcal nuclease